jgi:hypothetical protein
LVPGTRAMGGACPDADGSGIIDVADLTAMARGRLL